MLLSVKQRKTVSSQNMKNFLSQKCIQKKFTWCGPVRANFFFGRTSDLENFSCFVNLPFFLCFTESNIVCGEGKGHTETISPCVLSVLVVFKDVVNKVRDLPEWTFLPCRPPVISQHWRDSMAENFRVKAKVKT